MLVMLELAVVVVEDVFIFVVLDVELVEEEEEVVVLDVVDLGLYVVFGDNVDNCFDMVVVFNFGMVVVLNIDDDVVDGFKVVGTLVVFTVDGVTGTVLAFRVVIGIVVLAFVAVVTAVLF